MFSPLFLFEIVELSSAKRRSALQAHAVHRARSISHTSESMVSVNTALKQTRAEMVVSAEAVASNIKKF